MKEFYQLQRQDGQPELVITPCSNKVWHEESIYIPRGEIASRPPFVDLNGEDALSNIKHKMPARIV